MQHKKYADLSQICHITSQSNLFYYVSRFLLHDEFKYALSITHILDKINKRSLTKKK